MPALKTALVLSAGGMFGAFHAGAWRTLARVLQPDLVVGTSIGALNGWAIAGGCRPEELVELWLDPAAAVLGGVRPARRPWRGFFDFSPCERRIRELWARYRPRVEVGVTATQLPALRPRLFRDSEIDWRHLAAACAVPFCFPAVSIDGRYYWDGGLLSALPIWAAAELGAQRVIAIQALPEVPSRVIRMAVRAVRTFRRAPGPPEQIQLLLISPGGPLGTLRDAVLWNRDNACRWIEWGERAAKAVLRDNSELCPPSASTG